MWTVAVLSLKEPKYKFVDFNHHAAQVALITSCWFRQEFYTEIQEGGGLSSILDSLTL